MLPSSSWETKLLHSYAIQLCIEGVQVKQRTSDLDCKTVVYEIYINIRYRNTIGTNISIPLSCVWHLSLKLKVLGMV